MTPRSGPISTQSAGQGSPFSDPQTEFVQSALAGARLHEREARNLRKLAAKVANPPAGTKMYFGVRDLSLPYGTSHSVRFVTEVQP